MIVLANVVALCVWFTSLWRTCFSYKQLQLLLSGKKNILPGFICFCMVFIHVHYLFCPCHIHLWDLHCKWDKSYICLVPVGSCLLLIKLKLYAVAKLGMKWRTLHYLEQNNIIYMVKIKLSTRNFIFTVVHVHQVKTLWLRPWLEAWSPSYKFVTIKTWEE